MLLSPSRIVVGIEYMSLADSDFGLCCRLVRRRHHGAMAVEDGAVDTSSVQFWSSWWARLFGHHPLVRPIDRLEAVIAVLVVVTVILVLPFACAFGTSVHERSSADYVQRRASQHQISATVTSDSEHLVDPYQVRTLTSVWWQVGGTAHEDVLTSSESFSAGEEIAIWVDGDGNRVAEVTPGAPQVEAVFAALSVWMTAVAIGAAVIMSIRRRFRLRRYAMWDRELDELIRP